MVALVEERVRDSILSLLEQGKFIEAKRIYDESRSVTSKRAPLWLINRSSAVHAPVHLG